VKHSAYVNESEHTGKQHGITFNILHRLKNSVSIKLMLLALFCGSNRCRNAVMVTAVKKKVRRVSSGTRKEAMARTPFGFWRESSTGVCSRLF